MTHDPNSAEGARAGESVRLSDGEARRLLARAAELDGARRGQLSVAQLREAALEAGIKPDALDAALRESEAPPSTRSAPWWVRLCMIGVPDRRAAMVYYWIFVTGLFLSPLIAWNVLPSFGSDRTLTAFAAMALCSFALWSTSRVVRWRDEHGWNSLK